MIQALKRKTLPGKLFLAVLLLVAAGAVFIFAAHGPETLPLLLKGPVDIYTLDVNELEGKYVTAEIDVLYDTYAETTSDGKTTHCEYIMPIGDEEFMGVNVPKKSIDDAEAVMDSTWAVMKGEATELDGSVLKITGTICHMDSQTEGFYRDTAESDYGGADLDIFLPLVLEEGHLGANSTFNFGLFCLISVVLAVMGIVTMFRALTGWYQRDIKAWCNAQPDPEAASAQLDDFYNTTTPFKKVRINHDFIMLDNGGSSWLLEAKNVAWAYQTTTQHRTNGIPTGKSYNVTVRSKAAKNNEYTIPVRKDAGAKEMLAYLHDNLHDVVFGFNPGWVPLYNAAPAEFATRVLAMAAPRTAAEPEQSTVSAVPAESAAPVADDTTAAQPTYAAEPATEAEAATSLTAAPASCRVLLRDAGERKIEVVSAIREATGLSLAEAKALTDDAYTHIDVKDAETAQDLVVKLHTLGADAAPM